MLFVVLFLNAKLNQYLHSPCFLSSTFSLFYDLNTFSKEILGISGLNVHLLFRALLVLLLWGSVWRAFYVAALIHDSFEARSSICCISRRNASRSDKFKQLCYTSLSQFIISVYILRYHEHDDSAKTVEIFFEELLIC